MEDSGNHLSNGSALAQKKLNSAGRADELVNAMLKQR